MKLRMLCAGMAASMLALVSCSDDKNMPGGETESGDVIRFAAVSKNAPQSRTEYGQLTGNMWPIYWVNGDQIAVYCPQAKTGQGGGVQQQTYTVANATQGSTTYTLTGGNNMYWGQADKHDFYTFYPSSAVKSFSSDGTITASLPASQDVKITMTTEDDANIYTGCNMDYALMAGHVSYNRSAVTPETVLNLPFDPAVTALDIEVGCAPDVDCIINSITIANPANDVTNRRPLAGTVTYSFNDNTLILPTVVSEENYTINVVFDQPVTLRSNTQDKLKVTVFVLPVILPDNMRVIVNARPNNNSGMTKICTKRIKGSSIVATSKTKVDLTNLPTLSPFSYETWMANIPNECYVSQLSLPGTHDAAAYYEKGASIIDGATWQTQVQNFATQLNSGIRVFDLRPTYNTSVDGNFGMAHGAINLSLSFKQALSDMVDWLAVHPTEMFIIRLKNETQDATGQESWRQNVAAFLLENIPSQYLITELKGDMTLGEGRGKILILSTDNYYNQSWIGGKISWGDNRSFYDKRGDYFTGLKPSTNADEGGNVVGTMTYSDYYKADESLTIGEITAPSESKKNGYMDQVLDAAYNNTTPTNWYWTWLNASAIDSWSIRVGWRRGRLTDAYNQHVADKVKAYPQGQYHNAGMVMFDWSDYAQYAGGVVKEAIINNNFSGASNNVWPMKKTN